MLTFTRGIHVQVNITFQNFFSFTELLLEGEQARDILLIIICGTLILLVQQVTLKRCSLFTKYHYY